jgi:hypothetical protein
MSTPPLSLSPSPSEGFEAGAGGDEADGAAVTSCGAEGAGAGWALSPEMVTNVSIAKCIDITSTLLDQISQQLVNVNAYDNIINVYTYNCCIFEY